MRTRTQLLVGLWVFAALAGGAYALDDTGPSNPFRAVSGLFSDDVTAGDDVVAGDDVTVGDDLTVTDDLSADDGLFATVSFSGGGTPCFTRGGNTTIQTCTNDGLAVMAAFQGQATADVWDSIKNTANGAACSSNTGAVCLNDPGGACWTDGSGNTVGCLTATGAITSTMVYDWTFNANVAALAASGTGTFAKGFATGAAATIGGGNWTPHVIGVGAGNFVLKLCDDAACTTTYLTVTAACTAAVLTPVAGVVGTAAVTKGKTLFANITTACGTTNPVGSFTAGFTQP